MTYFVQVTNIGYSRRKKCGCCCCDKANDYKYGKSVSEGHMHIYQHSSTVDRYAASRDHE